MTTRSLRPSHFVLSSLLVGKPSGQTVCRLNYRVSSGLSTLTRQVLTDDRGTHSAVVSHMTLPSHGKRVTYWGSLRGTILPPDPPSTRTHGTEN